MIKVIYPKGSIIGEIGDKRQYCIVDIKDDGYEVIDYPFGVQGKTENRIINYDDVGSLLFWGYMGEEYTFTKGQKWSRIKQKLYLVVILMNH